MVSSYSGDTAAVTVYQWARVRPQLVSVVAGGGVRYTVGEVVARANQLSNALVEATSEHDGVAYAGRNSVSFVIVYLACMQIGRHFVPFHPGLDVEGVRRFLTESRATVLVAERCAELPWATRLGELPVGPGRAFTVSGECAGWADLAQLVDGHDRTPPAERTYGQPVHFTAGTTGAARPVKWRYIPAGYDPEMIQEMARQRFVARGLTSAGTSLVSSPMCYGAPCSFATQALHQGHTVVLMDRWDAREWSALVESERVTHAQLAPAQMHDVHLVLSTSEAHHDLSSLRYVSHGGGPCDPHVKHDLIRRMGPIFTEYYSASEGFATSIDSSEWLEHPGSVGHVSSDGAEISILDPDGDEVEPMTVGDVYVGHRRPVGAAQSDEVPARRTFGDRGWVDHDGWLYLAGRADDVIVSGSVNVSPVAAELVLRRHDDVADCAVIGRTDPKWGSVVVAVVVPAEPVTDPARTRKALADHCRSNLKATDLPREFVFASSLPYSDAGKLLRRTIRDRVNDDRA